MSDLLANDKDFLMWVRNRLVNVLGDDPDADWVKRLEDMSIFLPGPTKISLVNGEVRGNYFRVATFRAQDLGEHWLIKKEGARPLRDVILLDPERER